MILFLVLIALLIAGFYGVKSLTNPAYAFALYMVMYPLEQLLQAQFQFFIQFDWLVNFLPPSLAIAGLVLRMGGGRRLLVLDRLSMLCYGLYAFAATSVVWSQSTDATMVLLKFRLPYIVAGLLIMPLTINTPSEARSAFKAFVGLATPIAMAMAIVPFKNRGVLIETLDTAEMGNPLAIGTFGATLAVVAMGFAFAARTQTLVRVIMVCLAFLGAYVTVRSQSRGQFITVLIGIVAVAWTVLTGVSRRNVLIALTAAIALGIGVFAIKDAFLNANYAEGDASYDRWSIEYMTEEFERSRGSMSYQLLREYLEAAARNPAVLLFGLGGSYSYIVMGIYCHVVPLEVLCEYGILAFGVLSVILVLGYQGGRAVLRKKDIDVNAKWPSAVLTALAAVHFVLMFKQGSLLSHSDFFGYLLVLDRIRVLGVPSPTSASSRSVEWRFPSPQGGEVPAVLRPPSQPATI